MKFFRNLSIGSKLTVIMLVVVTVAVMLAGGQLLLNDRAASKRQTVANTQTLAQIIGYSNAAALMFMDSNGATESLASLRANSHVLAACIYDPQGELFASYVRSDSVAFTPPSVQQSGFEFVDDYLDVFQRVEENGMPVGTVFIRTDMLELREKTLAYVETIPIVLLIVFAVSGILIWRLGKVIVGPIRNLSNVAQTVSENRDYGIRAEKASEGELGVLVDSFNEMLDQIQERDNLLQQTQGELEKRVEERTAELEEARKELEKRVDERTIDLTKASEEIELQHQMIMEMSTPVVRVWDGVLLVPLIGMFDTARSRQMIDSMLESIATEGAGMVVLDVTGVPQIDTSVARHLMEAVGAARILGSQVIITGFSPEAAQTLAQLGVDFSSLQTRGSLKAGIADAFRQLGVNGLR